MKKLLLSAGAFLVLAVHAAAQIVGLNAEIAATLPSITRGVSGAAAARIAALPEPARFLQPLNDRLTAQGVLTLGGMTDAQRQAAVRRALVGQMRDDQIRSRGILRDWSEQQTSPNVLSSERIVENARDAETLLTERGPYALPKAARGLAAILPDLQEQARSHNERMMARAKESADRLREKSEKPASDVPVVREDRKILAEQHFLKARDEMMFLDSFDKPGAEPRERYGIHAFLESIPDPDRKLEMTKRWEVVRGFLDTRVFLLERDLNGLPEYREVEQIREALRPLVDAYKSYIDGREDLGSSRRKSRIKAEMVDPLTAALEKVSVELDDSDDWSPE